MSVRLSWPSVMLLGLSPFDGGNQPEWFGLAWGSAAVGIGILDGETYPYTPRAPRFTVTDAGKVRLTIRALEELQPVVRGDHLRVLRGTAARLRGALVGAR